MCAFNVRHFSLRFHRNCIYLHWIWCYFHRVSIYFMTDTYRQSRNRQTYSPLKHTHTTYTHHLLNDSVRICPIKWIGLSDNLWVDNFPCFIMQWFCLNFQFHSPTFQLTTSWLYVQRFTCLCEHRLEKCRWYKHFLRLYRFVSTPKCLSFTQTMEQVNRSERWR